MNDNLALSSMKLKALVIIHIVIRMVLISYLETPDISLGYSFYNNNN